MFQKTLYFKCLIEHFANKIDKQNERFAFNHFSYSFSLFRIKVKVSTLQLS